MAQAKATAWRGQGAGPDETSAGARRAADEGGGTAVALGYLMPPVPKVTQPLMSAENAQILLIEDDQSLQQSLREFFEDSGHETLVAGSLAEGERLLRAVGRRHGGGGPAVICLLDLNLPDGSGLDLLRQIVQEGLNVKVIVTSAYPIQHLRGRFSDSVLVAMMTKPISPQQLLEVVDKILRNGASVG